MNLVVFVGRLTNDPVMRVIPNANGKRVCNFSIAVDREYLSKEKKDEMKAEGKQTCDFFDIEVATGQAEVCGKYLKKGLQVGIKGRMKNNRYENIKDDVKYVYDKNIVNVERSGVNFIEWGEPSDPKVRGEIEKGSDFYPAEEEDDLPF
jgi:single-strand DNA-binding protein